ncbi:MAG: hypothetical protein HYX63_18710 [Gammaproteobacteria bacterium]|nr:hypothetical protein [Gammaproteobacteria bacterium]
MTLNEVQPIALAVDDIDQDLASHGLTVARVHDQATRQLTADGIALATADGAITAPHAGLLRIRVITNHDASGFYHLAVKLELRQKIPLGNTAGGFISQAVWTSSKNGVMLASEPEKVDALVTELVGNFVHDYRAQNPAGRASRGTGRCRHFRWLQTIENEGKQKSYFLLPVL